MGHHTFDPSKAAKLENPENRYRYISREELLWALDLTGGENVADLGSGTGFYTDVVAPHAEHIYGIDIQEAMHDFYRDKGVPENVELLTSGIEDLPFASDHLDDAVSTMTYHEFASKEALSELARVLNRGGRLVIGDWSANGTGEAGPPLEERFSVSEAVSTIRAAGFDIEFQAERPETFLVVGVCTE